jgi:hypothetical protein
MLRADILPALGHDRAEAISKLHVMQVVEAVAARGFFVAECSRWASRGR